MCFYICAAFGQNILQLKQDTSWNPPPPSLYSSKKGLNQIIKSMYNLIHHVLHIYII